MLRNRNEAGVRLAELLRPYAGREDLMVLALPRGGVPVACAIARRLHAPLDVFLVRKLGMPGDEEFAMGAIASGGVCMLDDVAAAQAGPAAVAQVCERERRELARREMAYRQGRPPPAVKGRTVIVVDDGLATGASMRVALKALRLQAPRRLIVAVPVAPRAVYEELEEADEVLCLMTPEPFDSVGVHYRDFHQMRDEEVQTLLSRAGFYSVSM